MGSLAINGLGRIGRAALKIIEQADGAEVVAVNDLVPPDNLAYLLRYDTVYGRWHKAVTADSDALTVQGRKIPVLAGRDPAGLPRRDLGVDLVLECTGVFRREEDLRKHLTAGARRVILSAPARTETVATVVHGVNQAPPDEQVVSCASSNGVAIRVPIPVGSIADVTAVTARPVTAEEVNDAFQEEAAGDRYRGIVGVADDPVVSADVIGGPAGLGGGRGDDPGGGPDPG